MIEMLFAKCHASTLFFLVFRQKSRNFYGIRSRIREREGEGERGVNRRIDSLEPKGIFDDPKMRKAGG